MIRRGSLSALTITQRVGDGQDEVRRERRVKQKGRSRDGREDAREPFSTHNTVSVRQWGLTTSARVSLGFISMRLYRRTLWCYSNTSVHASVCVCVCVCVLKENSLSFKPEYYFHIFQILPLLLLGVTTFYTTAIRRSTSCKWVFDWQIITHSKEKVWSKLKWVVYKTDEVIILMFFSQKGMVKRF